MSTSPPEAKKLIDVFRQTRPLVELARHFSSDADVSVGTLYGLGSLASRKSAVMCDAAVTVTRPSPIGNTLSEGAATLTPCHVVMRLRKEPTHPVVLWS